MSNSDTGCLKIALELFNDGDIQAAQALYSQLAASNEDCVVSRRALAKIHTQKQQWEAAVIRWTQVREKRPDIREVPLRLARLFKQLDSLEQSLLEYEKYLELEPEHAESIKSVTELKMQLKHAACKDIDNGVRHLAIAGVSYSGSTILSRVLGNIEGVENVGESHRLVSLLDSKTNSDLDFEKLDDETTSYCHSCGKDCEVFTIEFRKQLQLDPTNWYFKIGEQVEAKVLLSSDKNHSKLLAKDPYLRMDSIVLFKSPRQAWYSNYRKINLTEWGSGRITDVDEYLEKWLHTYQHFVGEFNISGKKVYLDFEQFCEAPDAHVRRLCQLFDLNFDPDILSEPRSVQHSFGGNRGVNDHLKETLDRIEIRKLPDVNLTEDHKLQIEKNIEIGRMHEQLQALYQRDFYPLNLAAAELPMAVGQ